MTDATPQPKKRGGSRPGAGRRKMERLPDVRDKNAAAHILDALNRPAHSGDSYEIVRWRAIDNSGVNASLDLRKYLYDKRDGKAVHTVNHLHDKPIEMNVNISMSEAIRKARLRVAEMKR